MSKTKRNIVISVICLIALAAVLAGVYFVFLDSPSSGEKDITVEVYHKDGTEKTFPISTNAEFLRGALEEAGLIEGTEGTYGLWVTTVDGYTADESKNEWWGYTKSGEYVDTAVDSTVIADGDVYEFTLNVGW
ncbi:MAG: DUF4430 domain-containing protein [Oscillospiraceae bacterium]